MPDFTFDCPHCGQSLEAPEELLGEQMDCPACNGAVQLPRPQPITPPPPAPAKKQLNTLPAKTSGDTRPCPYCGEAILRTAQKCRYCGEFLKGEREVKTNVKQGALIGCVACFGIGLVMMFFSLWTFIMYVPLFLAAFVLSIVAMAQKRVVGGILTMLLTVIVPPVLFFGLGAVRTKNTLDAVSKSLEPRSFATRSGLTAPACPTEVTELAKNRLMEAAKKGRYELKDIRVKSATKMTLNAADVANGIQQKWSVSLQYLKRFSSASGSSVSDWREGQASIGAQQRDGEWKIFGDFFLDAML